MAPKRKASALEENSAEQPTLRRSARARGAAIADKALVPSSAQAGKESPKVVAKNAKRRRPTGKDKANGADSKVSDSGSPATAGNISESTEDVAGTGDGNRQYWLMKAEPEPRFERGVDVSFSIDDLAAKSEPEPWDGIRNYVARNNLRAMKKGDLAFFYHSNCKEPGIVGTMEVVQEHSPDFSAHDSKAPYYDASSKPDNPKWSVVHVEFRSKFAAPITLKELRELGSGPGKPLQNMQMLKQSRLSVSKVSEDEWEHLMGIAKDKGPIRTAGV
ncbi:uncharacterized protein PpBr36_06461 [Pyricularia pennisetigena]|uniref:uncharacterized protein n=1 Tax=Pyricularia pennisetigena TaxID=1578925 RepID=UPI001154DF38|nr:uncharacterized protein PpBr36_06461 [Pyricularia pennisetigena]TLS23215.1 hypothetical protein PpBr36_06461 [Pyricularia pennisetigena]